MKCAICKELEGIHSYKLVDNSTINICNKCGEIVYGINFAPAFPEKLSHIIRLIEYINEYKQFHQSIIL